MSDLVAFLRARLDEDEFRARSCHDWPECGAENWEVDGATYGCPAHPSAPKQLADVEAKRRIIDLASAASLDECRTVTQTSEEAAHDWALTEVLELLAQPYADHANFDPEWKLD